MAEYKKILFSRRVRSRRSRHRPEAHNALDKEMSDELQDAVRRCQA